MVGQVHLGTPAELFRELVDQAVNHQHLDTSADSTCYLVQLLDAFVAPNTLYSQAEIDSDLAVAEIFCTAVTSDGMRKFRLLKLSGDLSLFLAGFFSDSLKRRAVDVDYYGQLGGAAYSGVALCCRSTSGATLFHELAVNFGRYVDVLTEVSESCSLTDDSDTLRLYERYARGGSQRCAEQLARRGIGLVPGAFDQVH